VGHKTFTQLISVLSVLSNGRIDYREQFLDLHNTFNTVVEHNHNWIVVFRSQ